MTGNIKFDEFYIFWIHIKIWFLVASIVIKNLFLRVPVTIKPHRSLITVLYNELFDSGRFIEYPFRNMVFIYTISLIGITIFHLIWCFKMSRFGAKRINTVKRGRRRAKRATFNNFHFTRIDTTTSLFFPKNPPPNMLR